MAGPSRRVLVFTATYNEVDNIGALVNRIRLVDANADILVVDDNSPDGTGALLDEMAGKDARLHVVHRPAKLGLGTAHLLAMLFAIRRGFDVLVTMDADHSHDPSGFPRLIDKLAAADFVIGSRYAPGGSCDYKGYRRFVSVAANTAARVLLGIPLHEFTTSFRAFRVRELAKVNFAKIHSNGYSFFMESVYRLHQAGLRVAEVPIHFRDRTAGTSKIPRLEILSGLFKLLHLSASTFLRRKMPPPAPGIEGRCGNCGSEFLAAFSPGRLAKDWSDSSALPGATQASAPMLVKCFQCGLRQVPARDNRGTWNSLDAGEVGQKS